jgi:hypothetical protein
VNSQGRNERVSPGVSAITINQRPVALS